MYSDIGVGMAKKNIYICQGCGYESPKWLGKCPDCGNWNSFLEEESTSLRSVIKQNKKKTKGNIPLKLSEIRQPFSTQNGSI